MEGVFPERARRWLAAAGHALGATGLGAAGAALALDLSGPGGSTFWPLTAAALAAAAVVLLASQARARLVSRDRAARPSVTGEQIEDLIERGTREGVLDEVKEELLNSVLGFADRVVKEIMVPRTRMVALDRHASPEELIRIVTENPYSRIPVYQGSVDEVVGVLLVREVLQDLRLSAAEGYDLGRRLKPAYFAPEAMKVSRLLKELQRRKTHLAIVVDEFGGTSGLVTLEDVLEEIVGEIQDEADAEAAPVRALGPGSWLADGSMPLHDLEAWHDEHAGEGAAEGEEHPALRFPDESDAGTLGGFVTARAGRVPPVGSVVSHGGFTFTVRAADERRVGKVEIARARAPRVAAAAVPS